MPGVPEQPDIGVPEFPRGGAERGEICFPSCSWGWETRRHVLTTYLRVHADVTGELIMDFDPQVYGVDADGSTITAPLPSPTPGIRLSARHGPPDAEGNVEPLLTVTSGVDLFAEPYGTDDLPRILEFVERMSLDQTRRIMREVTESGDPVLRQELLPEVPSEIEEGSFAYDAYNFLRELLVYRHLPSLDGAPLHYFVQNNIVYWPLAINENLSRFLA
jgi:hypothetical protein